MGASVVDAFLRGNLAAWIPLFALVALAAGAAIFSRRQKASPGRVLLVSALVSLLAAGGVLAGTALGVPRIVWRRAPAPGFAAAAGSTWRTLRGPTTVVVAGGKPEVGLAGVDAAGRVRLYGLFSGAPLEGFPDAPLEAPQPGAARICRAETEECRTWPASWPAPAPASSGSDFVWTRDLTPRVRAFDAESGLFLHHVEGMRTTDAAVAMAGGSMGPAAAGSAGAIGGPWALEQLGKLSNEPSREGPTALFVVRRLAGDRLDAVRVVAVPAAEGHTFTFDRATVSLSAAPIAFTWFGRPLLLALVLWFPAASIAFQAAPAWWASRRRKRMAAGEPLSELPATPAEAAAHARKLVAESLHGPMILAVGLALTAPAVVAIVGMLTSR